MKALRFLIACISLCSIVPVAAQETMDETTLRQHLIMAEGKPPDSYVATTQVTTSTGEAYTVREFHRGLDYRETLNFGKLSYGSGRFQGREWDQNPNGLTTIHEPASGLERPDARNVSITRVSQPLDAWKYETLNASGTGTVKYLDPKTYLLLRQDYVSHNGTSETDYDDFRSTNGYTIAFHEKVDNEINHVIVQRRITSFDLRPITDEELAIPPSRLFVTFPPGRAQVELPVEFIERTKTQMTRSGQNPVVENEGIVRAIVRVDIGDRGVDFILDSGASGIFIDQNVVRELGLQVYAPRSHIVAGRFDSALAVVPSMRVGDLEMRDVLVESVPYTYDAKADRKVVGVLGYDFIRAVGLTIDYRNRKLTAMPAGNVTPPIMTPESDILPIRLGSHVPMVTANINGSIAERMIVDTGMTGDMALFDYFSRRYPEAISPRVAIRLDESTFSGLGGAVKAKGYRLSNVEVGRYHFQHFDVTQIVSQQSFQGAADGLIGTGILRHFAVTFDYAGGKMYLVHNEGQ